MGSHPAIIQSVFDFDALSGKKSPSVVAIIATNRKAEKYFFGSQEMLVPCFRSIDDVPTRLRGTIAWALNLQSGRRAGESTAAFFEAFPHALGAHIFAENVPESHALRLAARFGKKHLILGPSGVGLLIPGVLKLGAIGGVDLHQMKASAIGSAGGIAVISTSGGMTNELIRAVADRGKRLSFAVAIGGDRFPITSLTELLTMAEQDPETKALVYFGELGGVDEYEMVELLQKGAFTKPVVAYVAGVIDEAFVEHVQFGHAKALALHQDESARAKREALRAAGAVSPDTFPEFLQAIERLPAGSLREKPFVIEPLLHRQHTILSTRSIFRQGAPDGQFAKHALEALLGRPARSRTTVVFTEAVFTATIDHGGHVSGAVNTMITARAGKDLVSSLVAGLLTIGPRFGGAVNASARTWLNGVTQHKDPKVAVEDAAKTGELIPGIGHRKYRVGIPDPRVTTLSKYARQLKTHSHYDFARAVERVTTAKNGKLILNVDGVIAALLLDILAECEGCSHDALRELVDAEFFNAFFVIPRTVGFIAHFLEQKRHDEGLFRLPDELLFERVTGEGE
jgi:ATP citrate (pro-S)-lyase